MTCSVARQLEWGTVSSSTAASGIDPIAEAAPLSLCARAPHVPADRLVAEMVPPPRFDSVRFATYIPDPNQPSQTEAVRVLEDFATGLGGAHASGSGRRRLFGFGKAPKTPAGPRGVYLDGGYGVGKTHLLASLWHATPAEPELKAFGTFVELTNLVGALGFQKTVQTLSGHRLLCIDEFELDDPGDTVLVSTLLGKLVDAGVALAATSNTLPGKLGEGRFAAADFLREIQGLSAHFRPLRIDGEDYRHRGLPAAPAPYSDEQVTKAAYATPGASLDDFPHLLEHLARVHPSRYGALTDGLGAVCLTDVQPVPDQSTALRLVVLADRLYDREVPVLASGLPFDQLFSEEMLNGGYRKKYFRAISRLTALARDAKGLVAA
ncbi:cell division protein ZapE [Streptomyces avermitilis]|uniref:ATP/GTP-binding protein n=2 Tax=Streptomyces avermitilis TaxID=33903 RepID=Q82L04_STRAW|nr:cell division protein ZapE [Streptomyces sp. SID5469]BAC69919.1 putative ATP/GTP-binding protein [Streptomyces avermitilis MA-4680 = NBRC 14893]BBJ49979.1 cell division protein ZapE [Streptomyces avermitilis]GDY61996.1 cell division protein ZapE [Streptomyces avermitilis]GDY77898.1 cell division protein ZapE [Streptomyces avermitilis]GDY86773.1 cell division protein ZapE [Streptomyces avermitilis]